MMPLSSPRSNKPSPPIITAYRLLLPFMSRIKSSSRLPFFILHHQAHVKPISFFKFYNNINNHHVNRLQVKEQVSYITSPRNNIIYTDAFKSKFYTGVAVHAPEIRSWNIFIPSEFSIFSAEMLAIKITIQFIIESQIFSALICFDSISSRQKLSSSPLISDDNLVMDTRALAWSATKKFGAKYMWIPGHAGIRGNEQADGMACTPSDQTLNVHIPYKDVFHQIKMEISEQWSLEWSSPSDVRAHWYKNITSFPFTRLWFKSIKFTPMHLCRIGVKENPACNCGAMDDIDHILFSCPLYKVQSDFLMSSLCQLDILFPTSAQQVLRLTNIKTVEIVNHFLSFINVLV